MPMQAADIAQEIRNFITGHFLYGRGETLNDDAPLMGNVVDSTGVLELISFVQQRFSIAVEDEEVMADNFGSVKSIVAFVEKKLAANG